MPRYALAVARGKWLTRRALLAHLAIAVWFPGCLAAAWWQVTVALAGDSLGYLYSVEWPVFALFGIVVWWHLVHDDPGTVGQRGLEAARARLSAQTQAQGSAGTLAPAQPTTTTFRAEGYESPPEGHLGGLRAAGEAEALSLRRPDEEDEELAAYNDYLAQLTASDRSGARTRQPG